jgi:hypothetical protein
MMNDNEIECPHCGSTFFHELTRCPTCGASVYPNEYEDEAMQARWVVGPTDPFTLVINSIGVVAAGLFVASAITIFLFFTLKRLFPLPDEFGLQTLIFFLSMIGAFGGGFVAARFSKHRASFHGLVVGLLSVGLSILLIAFEEDIAYNMYEFPPLIIPIIGWGLITLSGLFGAELAIKWAQKVALEQLFSPPRSEEELYKALLTKVRYDHSVAKRLIEYERKHAPNASNAYLIQNAIRRWERDNQASDLL